MRWGGGIFTPVVGLLKNLVIFPRDTKDFIAWVPVVTMPYGARELSVCQGPLHLTRGWKVARGFTRGSLFQKEREGSKEAGGREEGRERPSGGGRGKGKQRHVRWGSEGKRQNGE